MIWKLLLSLAAVACCVLALSIGAGSVTKNVDITVTHGAQPAVPPGAAAAGFTTAALNSDFSLPKYSNALNDSWLCKRATDNGSHSCEWYDGIFWGGNVNLDGDGNSTIGQVFDATIGKNVLEMTWKKSYCNAYFSGDCGATFNVIETVSYADQGEALTPQLAEAFPGNNAYIEWRMRDNLFSLTDGDDTIALVWWLRCQFASYSCASIGQDSFAEIDIVENFANHCGSGPDGNCAASLQACHAWGNGWCGLPGYQSSQTWGAPIGNPMFTDYHTYGILITSNGTKPPSPLSLSNGNLTVTSSADYASFKAFGTRFLSSGKFGFRISIGSMAVPAASAIGMANSSESGEGFLGQNANSFEVHGDGVFTYNGVQRGTLNVTYGTGSVVDLIVDLTNKVFWIRSDGGLWNGSSGVDPVAGTGGLSISELSSFSLSPAIALYGAGYSVTATFAGGDIVPGIPYWGGGTFDLSRLTQGYLAIEECSFIDDVLINCIPFSNGFPASRHSLEMAMGMATFGQLVPSTNDEHMWVQFVRVWSCADWNGSEPARQCNRTGICDNSGPGNSLVCH